MTDSPSSVKVLAPVNPAALILARGAVGMPREVAARKTGVTPERWTEFESGVVKPTMPQLRKIASIFRRPVPFFYLEHLPPAPDMLVDYRRLPDANTEATYQLLDAILAARARRVECIRLHDLLGVAPPPPITIRSMSADDTAVASEVRGLLGVTIPDQHGWRDEYEALRGWVRAVESRGILVGHFGLVAVKVVRGFTLAEWPCPIIALNGKDDVAPRMFTLLHELLHILLGESAMCDPTTRSSPANAIEQRCNRIAGLILVPPIELDKDLANLIVSEESMDATLATLSSRYRVSREVILRRLVDSNRVTESYYRRWRRARQGISQTKRKPIPIPPARKTIKENGRSYTGLALSALHHRAITASDFSRILGGVKLNHLEAIEKELGRP